MALLILLQHTGMIEADMERNRVERFVEDSVKRSEHLVCLLLLL